jgi:preprotein translocase subunit YajC
MAIHSFIVALSGPPPGGGPAPHPLIGMLPMVLIFLIFYFVLIMPARNKQKKLESMVSSLKEGDRIVINPGILGTVVSLGTDDTLQVRVDDKTKIRILRSAVAGLQDASPETEKK